MKEHLLRQKKWLLTMVVFIALSCFSSISAFAAAAKLDSSSEYYLKSVAYPDKAVNVYVDSTSKIVNKTAVNLYKIDKSKTQRFTFKKNKKGNYLMIPSGSKYTVNVSSLAAGTKVFTWKNKAANNEYFIIETTGDGYYTLRMEKKASLYLTATKSGTLTLKTKAKSGNSQKFAIVNYTQEKASSSSSGTTSNSTTPADTSKKPVAPVTKKTNSKKLAVPVLRQTDTRWRKVEFVKNAYPKCTIGRYGCLMTSVTAVMSYYDHTVYRPDKYFRQPGTVLKFQQVLPQKGKYKKWSLKKRSADAGNMKAIKGWANGKAYKLATVKKQIDKGNPVIVGGKGKKGYHYVVVTGYKNGGKKASDYSIMDPSRQSSNLQQHLKKYGHRMYYKR